MTNAGRPLTMDTLAHDRLLAGRYRLGPLLGLGGMAEVFEGFDTLLLRPVAIKMMRPEMVAVPGMRDRFEREARLAARLAHPNVVSVFDSGADAERAFLVMERLPGETLADRFEEGVPVDASWLVQAAGQVLDALAAAHAIGLVHRDIKPANVLLAGEDRVKVADFGIAKAATDPGGWGQAEPLPSADRTTTGLVVGTPAYLAPERIDGCPATAAADIYSVAVILYEGLTGRQPFRGETPLAVAYAARHGQAPDLAGVHPGVDPRLAEVVRKGMAVRPEDRFVTAAEMAAVLRGDLGVQTLLLPPSWAGAARATDDPPQPPEPPSPPQPPLPVTRPRDGRKRLGAWVLALAGAVAVVAVATLLAGAGGHRRLPEPAGPSIAGAGAGTARTTTAVPTTAAPITAVPTTAVPTTAAPPPATVAPDPAARALARYAAQLSQSSQPGAGQLAAALEAVATTPEGAQRTLAASSAYSTATSLLAAGSITRDQYQQAMQLLQQAVTATGKDHGASGPPGKGR